MATSIQPLTERPAWKALQSHRDKIRDLHLRTLFGDDPKRGERLTAEAAGLFLDYSKNPLRRAKLLLNWRRVSLPERIDAMFRSEKIITENRAVLHVALQAPRGLHHGMGKRCPEVHRADRMSASRPCAAVSGRATPANAFTGIHYRNRRLRSRAGDGLRSIETLQRPRHDLPLRLQRGWD